MKEMELSEMIENWERMKKWGGGEGVEKILISLIYVWLKGGKLNG